MPLSVIDLFCGAGGMSLGFHQAGGFRHVFANDLNAYAAATYAANFGDVCAEGDLVTLLTDRPHLIPRADIVVGGPPCQGFSLLNKNRSTDPRKQLWRPYLDVVERSGANVFVMENVPQLLGTDEHREILAAASALGFLVRSAKICAADYGVAQVRYRAILFGSRLGDPSAVFPPPPSHADPRRESDLPPWRTVRDAIGDLPAPVGTEISETAPPTNLHFGRNPTATSLARYRAIPREGMNRFDLQRLAPQLTPACWVRKTKGGTDLFGRLWWDRPAFTMRTEFYKPEKGRFLHPEQHRPITHREAARFQGFPDDFAFSGTKIQVAIQIGNAVPPPLARALAEAVGRLAG